jgi:phosphomannomutase
VIHNLLTSRHVPELIASLGAVPVKTKVGHSLIKDEMAATGAVFGGEHSAHYYFKNFWGADNGMLAALHVLSELGSSNLKMSELASQHSPYFASGEINSKVTDAAAAQARVAETFVSAEVEHFDGSTYSGEGDEPGVWWWLNVRSSNTEPLLRLNVESNSESEMERIRDKALAAIRN